MGSFSICSDDTDKDDAVVYRGTVGTDSYVAHGLIAVESSHLLLRRRDGRYLGGLWDIPGGTVEAGESPEGAVVRECLEETGLIAICGELLAHYTNPDTEGRDIVFHTMTYRMIIANHGTVAKIEIAEAEHDEAQWLSLDDALKLPLVWHVRRTLEAEQNEGIK